MRTKTVLTIALLLLAVLVPGYFFSRGSGPDTQAASMSYATGFSLGRAFHGSRTNHMHALEGTQVLQGFQARLDGHPPRMTRSQIQCALKELLSHEARGDLARRQPQGERVTASDHRRTEKQGDPEDVEQWSYAKGFHLASTLLDDPDHSFVLDPAQVLSGFDDGSQDRPSRLGERELSTTLERIADAKAKNRSKRLQKHLADGHAFLLENAQRPGVIQSETGLQYKVIRPGQGSRPTPQDTVQVHYRARLIDGREFRSSYRHDGGPVTFRTRDSIRGWAEILPRMSEGSIFEVCLPSDHAYGSVDYPGVPGNSVLIYTIELMKIL